MVPPEVGISWYVGSSGAGKTTLAFDHLAHLVEQDHKPGIVVDSVRSSQFADLERADTLPECIDIAWNQRRNVAWTPTDPDQVNVLALACIEGRNVHLLVDEAAWYMSATRSRGGNLVKLLRTHRHAGVSVQLTTQHLSGDVPQEALSCAPLLYVFQTSSLRSLLVMEQMFGIPKQHVRKLQKFEYLTVKA